MRSPEHAASVELEVPFYDCDPLAVVWHGRYFQYFELARTQLLQAHELDVPQLRDLGVRLYISDVRCRYQAPLTYGDLFRVHAWFTEVGPLLRIVYQIHNLTQGRLSARASTRIAMTDARGDLLQEVPAAIAARLPKLAL